MQAAGNMVRARILRSERVAMAVRIRSAGEEAGFLRRTHARLLPVLVGPGELPARLAQLQTADGTRSVARETAPLRRRVAV